MTPSSTPIALPLRLWFGAEVLFGVAAVSAVGLAPADTATNFAWSITPPVMAAMLGAFYLASALLAVLAVLAHRWEMVRVIILPLALFTTVQLLLTFLHWDKFAVGSTPFALWFASYLFPPVVFVGAYVWHQRRSGPRVSDQPLPPPLRALLVGLGVVLLAAGAIVFAVPSLLVNRFAWGLTPLTTRTFMGWVLLLGAVSLSMAVEDDRSRVRIVGPSLVIILPAALLQAARYSDQIDWANPLLLALLTIFAVLAACGLYVGRGDWRVVLGAGPGE